MKEPEKFPKVLTGVMIFISVLFTSIGSLSYATFGSSTKTVVIINLPDDDPLVQTIQLLYALAILLSIPLQLFPAIRIMEQGLFVKSGKDDRYVKWQKNIFRFLTVIACALISWGGASDLDKFVSLIGAFAW
jgi:proton-coupled amino acid transporter